MSIQLIIVVSYFVLTVLVGLYTTKKSKTSAAFHGASLGVMMAVAAGTGEWLGGTSTTGVAEYGYSFGISGAWYTIANGVGILFLAIFLAKLYRSLGTVTVPGIIGNFIGDKARTVSSILLTIVMLIVGTSQVIAAGTLGAQLLHVDYRIAVVLLGAVFIIYTLAGGMNAVASTNIMHLIIMYGGMILAVILVVNDVGFVNMKETLPDSYFSWTGIGIPRVSSWMIASILGACTAQAGIQPILAAKNENVARTSAFITALIVAPFGIMTALLGMAARVKLPDLTSGKDALPALMMEMNPIAGGLVLASIMAAVLSTVSPLILASSTMFTKDIYQRHIIKLDEQDSSQDKKLLQVSRISTGLSGIICIATALLMYDSTMILDMVYFAYTLRGSIFVVLILAIYWKKVSEKGAIISMLISVAVGIFWVAYKAATGTFPIHNGFTETYATVLTALISVMSFSLIFHKENGLKELK